MAFESLRGQLDPKRMAERRDLNNGFGDALATAFELAVTTALLGVLGWRLDVWLGTSPLFLLVLVAFTAGYEFWKLYRRYDADMREHEAKILGSRVAGVRVGEARILEPLVADADMREHEAKILGRER